MRAWLMKYNLWAIVDEKESEPPDDKAEEQKDWRKRRDKAAGELFLAVSSEERAHFGGVQDDPVKM